MIQKIQFFFFLSLPILFEISTIHCVDHHKIQQTLDKFKHANSMSNYGKCPCKYDYLSKMSTYDANPIYTISAVPFGGGTQGMIFHGYHKILRKCVAIKVMKLDRGGGFTDHNLWMEYYIYQSIKQFAQHDREVSKRIVEIFDLYYDKEKIVLFMELGEQSVEKYWNTILNSSDYSYGAKVDVAKMLIMKLVKAFITLHSLGIMHCDFKISNAVMVADGSGNYSVKLIDFGGARTAASNKSVEGMNAQVKNVFACMTLVVCAPEQMVEKYDAALGISYVMPTTKSDIWALGANLFFMLTHVFTGAFFTPEECNERSMQKLAIWIANSNVINSQNAPLLHMALACLHVEPKKRPMAFQLVAYLSNWCTMGLSSYYQDLIGLKPRAYDGTSHRIKCITMKIDEYHEIIKKHNGGKSVVGNFLDKFKRNLSIK